MQLTPRRIALILLLITGALDVLSTLFGLHIGLYEGNFIAQSLYEILGPVGFIVQKTLAITLIYILSFLIPTEHKAAFVMTMPAVIWLSAFFWNLHLIHAVW